MSDSPHSIQKAIHGLRAGINGFVPHPNAKMMREDLDSLEEQFGTLHALLTEITERDVNGLWSDQGLVDRVRAALNPATSPPADPRNNRQFPTATGSYDQPSKAPDPASSLKRYEDELAVPCQEPERSSLVDGEGLDPASRSSE